MDWPRLLTLQNFSLLLWVALALDECQHAINARDIESLKHTIRPFDLQPINTRRLAQTETETRIILRAEACAAKKVAAADLVCVVAVVHT